ncbi:phage tail protein [Phosphitispora fastidiosa]|uniref:phage tail protein n=1 Tax=Phosphitispora fastidiosa TaxID=2837202 RepID=UPI001E577975|nr:phage tail protein [Phosphitispora fastidiosa]MBU7005765.1 phage tail-like protein [Phosphitispora fastidiosa]
MMNKSESDDYQFLVLHTKSAWHKGLPVHIDVTGEGLQLQETRDYIKETVITGEGFPGSLEMRDFTVGPCCLVYVLDSEGLVWVYDVKQKRAAAIDCIRSLFIRPEGIAWAPGTIYIADRHQKKVLALAEINWQIRWVAGPEAQSAEEKLWRNFDPITVQADKDGSLYILTPYDVRQSGSESSAGARSVPAGGRAAVVKFDKSGRFAAEFDVKVELTAAIEIEQLNDAVNFYIASDGSLFILETAGRRVIKFLATGVRDWEKSQWTRFPELPSGITIDGGGNLYIGEGYRLSKGIEERSFIHKFSPTGDFLDMVPFFEGAVEKLQIEKDERIYIYSKEKQELTILKPVQTYFRSSVNPLPSGTYFSGAFAAPASEMRWHKLVIDAEIPENTQVKVSYLTSNDKEFTINGQRVNLEVLLACPATLADNDLEARAAMLNCLSWSVPLVNAKDALIHCQAGRYLWLKIELTGSKEKSPLLKSIRAYFPRTSYLRYLPAVYQENEQSRDFLERFLSLFETFFSQTEVRIGHIERFFDADSVSGDFLRWLGTWLAIAEDENWPEDKLRLLIKKAPGIYKKRGTREGITEMINVYTGDKPFIVERFQLKCSQAEAEFGELLVRLFSDDPYSFTVLLKPFQVNKDNEIQALKRIIDTEKPAYTKAAVVALRPWIYLDMHTYLGVNTYLTKPSLRLDVGSVMPQDTVLTDGDEAGQIGRRTKLGCDTTLT